MIKEFLEDLGIFHFGMAEIPQEFRPFPSLPYAISLGVPLSKPVVSSIKKGPTPTYFHHYRTTNAFLDHAALRLQLKIESEGCQAVYVPASQTTDSECIRGLISHKMVAVLSGLGGIGMNALFVSGKLGPAIRLSTVLTDYPLPRQYRVGPTPNPCSGCGACVKNCPAGALFGAEWKPGIPRDEMIDAKKCSQYMKRAYQHIGRGAVCGICMAVCPLCELVKPNT